MRSVKSFIAAGAATLLSSAAFAADMAIAPPPYAPVVEDFGGWYLRGDIGFSNQRVDRLNNVLDRNNTTSVQNMNFNTAGIFGLGVGYKFNNWFRTDVTGEYRGNSQFFGTDQITYVGGVGTDTYHATKNEWVVLANAYVDLGTWWCITPFIGAGVGGARVAINGFTDQGIALNGGTASLDLVISSDGGVVEGIAVDHEGEPVANALVVAVPESRLRSRNDHYRKTVTDQSGRFTLRGIRPGDYTLFAWESVEGDAYYNSDFLKSYEQRGTPLQVAEGNRKNLQVEVIPEAAVDH